MFPVIITDPHTPYPAIFCWSSVLAFNDTNSLPLGMHSTIESQKVTKSVTLFNVDQNR